jgi:predicted GNAT family acetyltransferase
METTVVDVPERGRFEVRVGERVVGLASYHVENGTMALPHTEVDPGMGGRGLGKVLVSGVLDAARAAGLTVLPTARSSGTTSSSTRDAGPGRRRGQAAVRLTDHPATSGA